jgi:hypothetical protein
MPPAFGPCQADSAEDPPDFLDFFLTIVPMLICRPAADSLRSPQARRFHIHKSVFLRQDA